MEKHREEYHCPRGLFPPHLTPTHTRILHYFPLTFSVSSQVPWFNSVRNRLGIGPQGFFLLPPPGRDWGASAWVFS